MSVLSYRWSSDIRRDHTADPAKHRPCPHADIPYFRWENLRCKNVDGGVCHRDGSFAQHRHSSNRWAIICFNGNTKSSTSSTVHKRLRMPSENFKDPWEALGPCGICHRNKVNSIAWLNRRAQPQPIYITLHYYIGSLFTLYIWSLNFPQWLSIFWPRTNPWTSDPFQHRMHLLVC